MMKLSTDLRWSCCRSGEKEAPGCQVDRHVIDRETQSILKMIDDARARESSQQKSQSKDESPPQSRLAREHAISTSCSDPAPEMPKLVRHRVTTLDTLLGLSLKYGVSVDLIKQANRMGSESVFQYKFLDIPNPTKLPSQEEIEADQKNLPKEGKEGIMISRFLRMASSKDEAEARFYLEECGWDVNKAVKMREDDLEWEEEDVKKKDFAQRIMNYKS